MTGGEAGRGLLIDMTGDGAGESDEYVIPGDPHRGELNLALRHTDSAPLRAKSLEDYCTTKRLTGHGHNKLAPKRRPLASALKEKGKLETAAEVENHKPPPVIDEDTKGA